MAGVAIAAMVIGAGIGAYSSYQSGRSQDIMAQMNAAQQERNARTQLISMQTQANLQKQQAEAEFYARSVESQARMNNATTIENQQLGQDQINRVNLRKRREESAQLQSTQRANIAASGLVESTGTPLDVLAETAETIQRDQEEQAYGFELQRRTIFREAQLERLGGQMALAGATLDRNSGLAAASLNQAAAGAEFRGNMRAAQITRAGGAFARQAGTLGAGATLFSGLGQAGGMYAQSFGTPTFRASRVGGGSGRPVSARPLGIS